MMTLAAFKWGAFITVNGSKGWNSVTLTATYPESPSTYYTVGDEWNGNPSGRTVTLNLCLAVDFF